MPSKKQSGNGTDSKPSPAPSVGETTMNTLPVLTEIVDKTDTYLPRLLSADEIQQLLPQLESQIETLFAKKLGQRLEQLQRQAIEQAILELKAELPDLLHDALYNYLDPSD